MRKFLLPGLLFTALLTVGFALYDRYERPHLPNEWWTCSNCNVEWDTQTFGMPLRFPDTDNQIFLVNHPNIYNVPSTHSEKNK